MELRTKAEETRARRSVECAAARAVSLLETQLDDADAIIARGPGVYLSAGTSLGAVAVAAHRRYSGRLSVWACTASLGVLRMLPKGTRVYLDESVQRRWKQPELLPRSIKYGRHHTKGFVLEPASGSRVVCLSSCNLSRGAGVEHYDLRYDDELATALLAWLGGMNAKA